MSEAGLDDADLVAKSLAGDRDAFCRIVERYQSLVCSLAYSATGNISQSEDVAQETFLAAWRTLRALREPAKLRSWLCGIARHRILDAFRHAGREPSHAAESLETAQDSPAPGPLPSERAITQEEEAILWRSLERIPEAYREPLVLFYRQHQSIESVARVLDLSEDAVKQRLSRGRKLLHEQVVAFVEGALERTTPGKTFTLAVLAALPAVAVSSAKAASLAAVGKAGLPAAKAVLEAGALGGLLGGLGGVLGGALGGWASWQTARYQSERELLRKSLIFYGAVTVAFLAGLFALTIPGFHIITRHPLTYGIALAVWIISYLIVTGVWSVRLTRRFRRTQAEEIAAGTAPLPETPLVRRVLGWASKWEGRQWTSRWSLFGLPLIDIAFSSPEASSLVGKATMSALLTQKVRVARGWIALGDRAHGILFACGNRAFGGIALGGLSVGVLAIGGVSAGLMSIGGVALGAVAFGGLAIGPVAWGGGALGAWAYGGLALGWMAFGGAAFGWQAAKGGLACAHELAVGGLAIARHANDSVARELMSASWFFRAADWSMVHVIPWMQGPWFVTIVLAVSFLVPLLVLAVGYRRRPATNRIGSRAAGS